VSIDFAASLVPDHCDLNNITAAHYFNSCVLKCCGLYFAGIWIDLTENQRKISLIMTYGKWSLRLVRELKSYVLNQNHTRIKLMVIIFLHCGRIACNAERCNSYSNSVRLPVIRWYPIQTNEDRIMRTSLWGSKNTSFLIPTMVGGEVPFHLKFALKLTHLPLKISDFDQYLLITSQP